MKLSKALQLCGADSFEKACAKGMRAKMGNAPSMHVAGAMYKAVNRCRREAQQTSRRRAVSQAEAFLGEKEPLPPARAPEFEPDED